MTILYGNFIEKFEHPRWDKQWEHRREHHKNIIKMNMCKLNGNMKGNILGNTWKEQQISSPSLDDENF
jgi:hypothetical protein